MIFARAKFSVSFCCVLLFTIAVDCSAGVQPIPGSSDLRKLMDASGLAASGTAVEISDLGDELGSYYGREIVMKHRIVVFALKRVYKGSISDRRVRVAFSSPADQHICGVGPCTEFRVGEYKLLFLEKMAMTLHLSTHLKAPSTSLTRIHPERRMDVIR